MDAATRANLNAIYSSDPQVQHRAFLGLLAATEQPVDWAYEAWDELIAGLKHKDNHVRAIASQLLCALAKSDPQGRMLKDFDALLAVTKDERFVTARHCLQALWQVGLAGEPQRQRVVDGLAYRFEECNTEKNATLIRFDIITDLRNLYDQVPDQAIREKALALIETETDLKYRKKYAAVWKNKRA